jgi:hypothetical protein
MAVCLRRGTVEFRLGGFSGSFSRRQGVVLERIDLPSNVGPAAAVYIQALNCYHGCSSQRGVGLKMMHL